MVMSRRDVEPRRTSSRGLDRGLLVTRFHYTNPVHPKLAIVTGMTRDGTFLVEDGKIVGPVRNLRYTQSYLDALAGTVAVGERAADAQGLPRRRRRPGRPHRRLELHGHDRALTRARRLDGRVHGAAQIAKTTSGPVRAFSCDLQTSARTSIPQRSSARRSPGPEAEIRRHPPMSDPTTSTPTPITAPTVASATTPATAPDLRALPDPSDPRATAEAILFEIRRVIVGQDAMLERVLVGLLSGGHLLLEGVPGLAKTLTIKTLADVLGGTFKRIQFTPDLMPSDLVGTRIYRPDRADFDVELGPVFANFLLADEINRAPAKVQSALLEVMQEHQVTIGHETYKVPTPFLVLATENPIEAEGTYPLPEAQVDRFMLKILLDYPTAADEAQIVVRSLVPPAAPREILDAAGLRRLQQSVNEVYVDPRLISYAVGLVEATRRLTYWGAPDLEGFVSYGASPRGSINLIHGARAMALLHGRRYVLPADIAALAPDVLRHRLVMSYAALADGDHGRHGHRARPDPRPGPAARDGGGDVRVTEAAPRAPPSADLGRLGGRERIRGPSRARARSPSASSASSSCR